MTCFLAVAVFSLLLVSGSSLLWTNRVSGVRPKTALSSTTSRSEDHVKWGSTTPIDSMPMYAASLEVTTRYGLDSKEGRQEFLENLIISGDRVDFNDALLVFALSVKDGGARIPWTFGVYDSVLYSLTHGEYTDGKFDKPSKKLIEDLKEALHLLLSPDDDLALRLMILNIRENVDDQSYTENNKPFKFRFGDTNTPSGVSEMVDKERREELFVTLALLRFVRLGLDL